MRESGRLTSGRVGQAGMPGAAVALMAFAVIGWPAAAQYPDADSIPSPEPPPSRQSFGEHTVYFSTVPSTDIPESVSREHDLPRGENKMLLIVAVERDGTNVEADVAARATNLAAQMTVIEMNPVIGNGEISYMGDFDVESRSIVDFEIVVNAATADEPFLIEFRERLF